jgi:hypothetical protein
MGVFISWSGKNTKSYMVADALRRWLDQVIQNCDPWMSSQDIDAGQRWATELFAQLDNLSVGIMCVTKANQGEPWLNFEAGALAKQLKADKPDESRVCPLLIDMTANDVTGPLKLLQMVPLDEHGVFKILQMVNKYSTPKPLNEEVLKRAFNKWWPDLETDLRQMKVPEQSEKSSRGIPEMLEEILGIVRSIDKTANRPSPFSYLGEISLLSPPPSSSLQEIASGIQKQKIVALKKKLVAEVQKTDSALAQALSAGTPSFDDQTLTIAVKYLVPEERLETAHKVAKTMGISLEIINSP